MPVTLAQAKLLTQDDLDAMIIDEFRKSSVILDTMLWHEAVSPLGGGSTLTYGYHRVLAQRAAAFRPINSEYTPVEASKARFTTDLKPLGGSFQIDRVLAQIARGGEVSFQMQQLIKSTATKFADEVINGDVAVDVNGFDGLDKALFGSVTEVGGPNSVTDWSNLDATTGTAQQALDTIDTFLSLMDGQPTLVLGNQLALAKMRAVARRANMYVESPVKDLPDTFGNPIQRQQFGNVVLVDPGDKPGSTEPIIPIYDPDNTVYVVTETGIPTGGTFTLKVTVNNGEDTASAVTGNIAQAATAANVDSALEALAIVGAGNVTVAGAAGGPWTVTFNAAMAERDIQLALEANALTGGTAPSVTTVESGNVGGLTDIYAVRIGMDGFHGVTVAGQPLIRRWLPDFERAGAVKTGEVEMGPVGVVLKATKAAAVLRGVRVR